MIKIAFLGSPPGYSQQVKAELEKAGYTMTDNTDQADLLVVAAHGAKIPKELLDKTPFGGLNIHPSLLPNYRGATPVPAAILAGETETGVTIIKMNDRIDQGGILAQQTHPITPTDTAQSLLNQLFSIGTKLLISILPEYLEGKITPTPQPFASPTPLTRKLTKTAGQISWQEFVASSIIGFTDLDLKIRAFYPWPGVWTTTPDNRILKIVPGNLVQFEGKNPVTFKQFLAGNSHLLQ